MGIPSLILQLSGKTSKTSTSAIFHSHNSSRRSRYSWSKGQRLGWKATPKRLTQSGKVSAAQPICSWETQVSVFPAENWKSWTGCPFWLSTIRLLDWSWIYIWSEWRERDGSVGADWQVFPSRLWLLLCMKENLPFEKPLLEDLKVQENHSFLNKQKDVVASVSSCTLA